MTVFPHPKAPKIYVKIVISMLCHIYYFDYCLSPVASNSKISFTWNGSGSTLHGWKQSIEYSLSGKQRMICWQFFGAGSRLTYRPYLYEQQNRQNYTVETTLVLTMLTKSDGYMEIRYLHKCIFCFFAIKFCFQNFVLDSIVAWRSKVCHCSSCLWRQ